MSYCRCFVNTGPVWYNTRWICIRQMNSWALRHLQLRPINKLLFYHHRFISCFGSSLALLSQPLDWYNTVLGRLGTSCQQVLDYLADELFCYQTNGYFLRGSQFSGLEAWSSTVSICQSWNRPLEVYRHRVGVFMISALMSTVYSDSKILISLRNKNENAVIVDTLFQTCISVLLCSTEERNTGL